MKANVSCSPTPHRISDGRMERLLLENRTQTRRMARIPRMPVNRVIIDLYRLPYGRGSVTSTILHSEPRAWASGRFSYTPN